MIKFRPQKKGVVKHLHLVGGFSPTPLKNDGVKVSWDENLPNIWKIIKFHGSKPPTSHAKGS